MGSVVGGVLGVGGGAFDIYQSYQQSEMLKIQGAFQKQQYEQNQVLAGIEAKSAIRRGDEEHRRLGYKGNQLIGAQRASLAAQGIDVNTDDAIMVQKETAEMIARDKSQIKANAFREAWGYKVQALNYNFQGQFTNMATQNAASSTLLSGGIRGLTSIGKGVAGGLG